MKQIIEFHPKEVARILLQHVINKEKIPSGDYICRVRVISDPENREKIANVQLTVSDPE